MVERQMAEGSIGATAIVQGELPLERAPGYPRNLAMVQLQVERFYGKDPIPLQVQSAPFMSPTPDSSPSTSKVKRKRPISGLQVQPLRQIPSTIHGVHDAQRDKLFCHVCQVPCLNSFNLKQHLEGQKHQTKLQELKSSVSNTDNSNQQRWCDVCKIEYTNINQFMRHVRGQLHRTKLQEVEFGQNHAVEVENQKNWCQLCQISCFNEYNLKLHLKGKKHASKLEAITKKNKKAKGEETTVMLDLQDSVGKMSSVIADQRHWCGSCKIWCINEYNFKLHLEGKRHANQLNGIGKKNRAKREASIIKLDGQSVKNRGSEIVDQQNWCRLCKIWCINSYNLKLHLQGKKHAIQHQISDKTGRAKDGEVAANLD